MNRRAFIAGLAGLGVVKAAKIPAFTGGSSYVPEGGLAMLHKGESVVPTGLYGSGNSDNVSHDNVIINCRAVSGMSTYYVDNHEGVGGNAGTRTAPFRNVSHLPLNSKNSVVVIGRRRA